MVFILYMVIIQNRDLNNIYRRLQSYVFLIYSFSKSITLYLILNTIISAHICVYMIRTCFLLFNIPIIIYIRCFMICIELHYIIHYFSLIDIQIRDLMCVFIIFIFTSSLTNDPA